MKDTQSVAPSDAALTKLSDSGLELADPRQDIRGRKILDPNGEEIGHVSSLFIDAGEKKVRMVEIRAGGFLGIGDRHTLLPVDAITSVTPHEVHVTETRSRIAGAPAYDPALVETPTSSAWEPFYGYYGLSPYWGDGYMYPIFPLTLSEAEQATRHETERSDDR
jgi:sporulation protein YlmC with PRC-barrel domain